MTVEKSELKAAIAHAIGCDADDDLEAAQRDALRALGRTQAAVGLEQEMHKIMQKLNADMESDSPPFNDLEIVVKVKSYLAMTSAACVLAAKQSDGLRLQMEGKVLAFRHTIKRMQKMKEIEEGKARLAKEIADNPDSTDDLMLHQRVVGAHPGPSIGDLRRAEALDKLNGADEEASKKPKKKAPRKRRAKAGTKKKAPKKKAPKKTP